MNEVVVHPHSPLTLFSESQEFFKNDFYEVYFCRAMSSVEVTFSSIMKYLLG